MIKKTCMFIDLTMLCQMGLFHPEPFSSTGKDTNSGQNLNSPTFLPERQDALVLALILVSSYE